MTKILEKFIKNIKKLDNYYILKEESNYLIMGSELKITERHEVNTNIFQPYSQNIERILYISFVLVMNETDFDINYYIKRKIPILIIPSHLKSSKLSLIQKYLNDYIKANVKA